MATSNSSSLKSTMWGPTAIQQWEPQKSADTIRLVEPSKVAGIGVQGVGVLPTLGEDLLFLPKPAPQTQGQAEARLAAKRAARAEAREIRMKELERQQKEASDEDERMSVGSRGSLRTNGYDGELHGHQSLSRRAGRPSEYSGYLNSGSRASSRASSARASPVVEERPEKDFTEKGSRNMPSLSAATLASLGGTSSRRGSGDTSISIDTEASIREIKDSLAEAEEKYKKAMVSNAQLDNEKTNFMYQVDNLKDTLLELEEQLAESRRQYDEKNKELEREKHAHSVLQFQFAEVKEALKQREEMLEKHGIILTSEVAANGEASSTVNSVSHQDATKMTEELRALKSPGDGTLGRASDVEVKNEMVENVGKGEILQNTEQERHKEDRGKDCVDIEGLRPSENTEDQKTSEDKASSPETLANAENEEQVMNTLDDRTRASPEEPKCLSDLGSQSPDPVVEQDGGSALDIKNEREESAEKQENEEQEDFKTNLGEVSTKPCQESVPLHTPDVERASGTDAGGQCGTPTESVVEAGVANVEEHMGPVASSPPKCSEDPVNQDENHTVDAPKDPSTECSLEKEITNQEVAEPKEAPTQSAEVGREHSEDEDEMKSVDEKPTEGQTIPCSPAAKSNHQKAMGEGKVDSGSEPLDLKERDEEKASQQGETLDSSQKKAKNKKKKNKKKKSPVPADTCNDVKAELTFQNTDFSEVKEEAEAKLTDSKAAGEAHNEVTKDAKQKVVSGSSENVEGLESPKTELNGKLNPEDDAVTGKAGEGIADRDALDFENDTIQSSGTSASEKELDASITKENAGKEGAAQSSPLEPEDGDVCARPSEEISDVSQTESAVTCVTSEHPSQTVEKVLENVSLGNDDSSAPAGELGDFESERKEDTRGGSEKTKSKEDCTMS
ncbi:leucine-rich repeat flightless-interacting protein 1 isoform X4 [Loxodonta africana]|uniref:leucine-rich repeat flightless-interacting protein 1 isoform X4 n=1 Tax=Loxodonta africana TaxID=9785 RepID=UPI0030D52C90